VLGTLQIPPPVSKTHKKGVHILYHEGATFGDSPFGTWNPGYDAIRSACKRRKIDMDMRFCRKVHGSWLHSHGVSTEEVDFLQGRVSSSVLSRHYLTPENTLRTMVLEALEKLQEQL
jgi:intergrase/recombinase